MSKAQIPLIEQEVNDVYNLIASYNRIFDKIRPFTTDADQTQGVVIYAKFVKAILNNLNVISDFAVFIRNSVISTTATKSVIRTSETEIFLNSIIDSSVNIKNILVYPSQGGWTSQLAPQIQTVFSKFTGICSRIISYAIAVCHEDGETEISGDYLIAELKNLKANLDDLSFVFDGMSKVSDAIDQKLLFFDDQLIELDKLLDTYRGSYIDAVNSDIITIKNDNDDFLVSFAVISSLRPSTVKYRIENGIIYYVDSVSEIELNFPKLFYDKISTKYLVDKVELMRTALKNYAKPFKSNLKTVDASIIKLLYNYAKNRNLQVVTKCVVENTFLSQVLESFIDQRFDALFTELSVIFFPVWDRHSSDIVNNYQNKMKLIYKTMKTRKQQADFLNYLKSVSFHTKIKFIRLKNCFLSSLDYPNYSGAKSNIFVRTFC